MSQSSASSTSGNVNFIGDDKNNSVVVWVVAGFAAVALGLVVWLATRK